MQQLFITSILFTTCYLIWCQDMIFPDDEGNTYLSGNKPMITERVPIYAPDQCPKNMLLYPGDGNISSWVCDCRDGYLYFPVNNSCHEAYRQGPCPPNQYVVLLEGEAIPHCVQNPCFEDGLVKYNNTCYPLNTVGPCGSNGILKVNETTFKVECLNNKIVPFTIIEAPQRKCAPGSRRNALGVCRKVI